MRFLGWCPPAVRRGGEALGVPLDRRAAARLAEPAGSRPSGWVEPVLKWNRRLGASEAALQHAREVLSGAGTVVLAGQQPGLLGGPLYTLYKLLTAVELAGRVERESGRPCLAVFWIVGDDADFGEVSWTFWSRPDLSVVRLRDESMPPGGTLVGRLPAGTRQRPLLADPSLFAAGGAGAQLRTRLEAALSAGETWSGALAALVLGLWPELPVLFLDGADPAVLAAQRGWLSTAAAWPLAALLREGEAEARAAGHEPAFDPSLGERVLFRVAGDRREAFSPADGADGDLAPNVVLRPLVQDFLLPNVATVCGPSEVRYRAQLAPLYRHAGLAAPVLWPRLRAVLVPSCGAHAAGLADDDWLALRDPDRWLARLADRETPASLRERTAELRRRLHHDLDALGPELGGYDSSLSQLLESVRGKTDFQLQRLGEGLEGKARQRLFRREPVLARWREFVRPRDDEQERSLCLLTPFLLEPDRRPEELRAAVREHLRRVGEGEEESAAVLELSPPEKGMDS